MRIAITFAGERGQLKLPRQYNQLVQGFIYRHLDRWLAKTIHDDGFADPRNLKRRLRLFTFSRLVPVREAGGRWHWQDDHIVFEGPVRLMIASPGAEFLSSLVEHLLKNPQLDLGERGVTLIEARVEAVPEHRRPALVRALSPIAVYSTLRTPAGKKKTYYYSPFEEEFSLLAVRNLARKVRAWTGEEVEAEGEIRPVRVSKRNEHVVLYKGTVIKAWDGIYELDLPEVLFRMAFDAGLGAKNSQGFGCIAEWRPNPAGKFRGRGKRASEGRTEDA